MISADAANGLDIDALGNVDFSFAGAGSDIGIVAGGAINGGDLDAGGMITLDGSLVAIGAANGTDISASPAVATYCSIC
ncbi:MAG: hypothetical protein R3E18_01770 [Sphingomonadaceae bacterium]